MTEPHNLSSAELSALIAEAVRQSKTHDYIPGRPEPRFADVPKHVQDFLIGLSAKELAGLEVLTQMSAEEVQSVKQLVALSPTKLKLLVEDHAAARSVGRFVFWFFPIAAGVVTAGWSLTKFGFEYFSFKGFK